MNALLSILKYLLLLAATGITFYGMLIMYDRLEKPITGAIPTILPFIILLIIFMLNIVLKQKQVTQNILYNITSVIALAVIIFIGYRAKFDTNMALYHQYGINFNPAFFSDNLSAIKTMLYCLIASNILLMFTGNKKKAVVQK